MGGRAARRGRGAPGTDGVPGRAERGEGEAEEDDAARTDAGADGRVPGHRHGEHHGREGPRHDGGAGPDAAALGRRRRRRRPDLLVQPPRRGAQGLLGRDRVPRRRRARRDFLRQRHREAALRRAPGPVLGRVRARERGPRLAELPRRRGAVGQRPLPARRRVRLRASSGAALDGGDARGPAAPRRRRAPRSTARTSATTSRTRRAIATASTSPPSPAGRPRFAYRGSTARRAPRSTRRSAPPRGGRAPRRAARAS